MHPTLGKAGKVAGVVLFGPLGATGSSLVATYNGLTGLNMKKLLSGAAMTAACLGGNHYIGNREATLADSVDFLVSGPVELGAGKFAGTAVHDLTQASSVWFKTGWAVSKEVFGLGKDLAGGAYDGIRSEVKAARNHQNPSPR